jgi:hypothetical protein
MRLVRFHDQPSGSDRSGIEPVPATDLVQPDEGDRIRVRWSLRRRRRYRYVNPKVRVVTGGLLIESPCCSRRIDPSGGTVDIAFVQQLKSGELRLYRTDYAADVWRLHGVYRKIADLIQQLNDDPDQLFWQ